MKELTIMEGCTSDNAAWTLTPEDVTPTIYTAVEGGFTEHPGRGGLVACVIGG